MAKSNPQDWLTHGDRKKRGVPEGLWLLCEGCGSTVFRKDVEDNLHVCPECDHHRYVPAAVRIAQLLDEDSFEEWHEGLSSCDPLEFSDKKTYPERLAADQNKTGLTEACVVGRGYMRGRPLVFGFHPLVPPSHGLARSAVHGVVSGIREIDDRPMIQLAMPVEPGNSGGPVLDRQGHVQGIVTLKSAIAQNPGFAVPINQLKALMAQPNPIPMSRWSVILLFFKENFL